MVPAQALKIGGDYRGTGGQVYDEGYNDQYFRGEIANISVWSDVRTAEQIQADVQALQADAAAVSAEGETLLASWQFDGEQDLYEDRSDRDNDVAAFVALPRATSLWWPCPTPSSCPRSIPTSIRS